MDRCRTVDQPSSTCWVHWDDVDTRFFGRVTRIDNHGRLVYQPTHTLGRSNQEDLTDQINDGLLSFIVPNCMIAMVRATGPFCTQVPQELLTIADVFDSLDSSGEASHALCRVCDKYNFAPCDPGRHIDCPICSLHAHSECVKLQVQNGVAKHLGGQDAMQMQDALTSSEPLVSRVASGQHNVCPCCLRLFLADIDAVA